MFAEQQQSVPLRPREPHSAMIYFVSYINLSLESHAGPNVGLGEVATPAGSPSCEPELQQPLMAVIGVAELQHLRQRELFTAPHSQAVPGRPHVGRRLQLGESVIQGTVAQTPALCWEVEG